MLIPAILLPLDAGVIVGLFLMSLEPTFRFVMVGVTVVAAILILGGLYWWGEKRSGG